ncbi:hypothetical protein TURU_085146 [Turdus rufiventris]|nr:hypothetical protein TURU_085146 [Turdus rufiventris]
MSKQQKANAHGLPREWQPVLYKRYGLGTRQSLHLPPVEPTRGVHIGIDTQPIWKPLGHSGKVELIKVQGGHGRDISSDLFKELGPHLRENRPVSSNWRVSKWLIARPKWEGIWQPAQQTAPRHQLCPQDEEARIQRIRKITEELKDKAYDEMFRAIFSSVDNTESPSSSSCILQDPPSPTLDAAAGPSEPHRTSRVTKNTAAQTPEHSELGSLDQLLDELGPVSDCSLSCDALVKELLEDWEQEELRDRKAAGQRVSETQSARVHPSQHKEGCVLRKGSSVTPQLAAGSQGPHSTAGTTKLSAGEDTAKMAPPRLWANLCAASADSPASDALLNELLEQWEQEELQNRAASAERNSDTENVMSHPLQDRSRGSTFPSGQQSLR